MCTASQTLGRQAASTAALPSDPYETLSEELTCVPMISNPNRSNPATSVLDPAAQIPDEWKDNNPKPSSLNPTPYMVNPRKLETGLRPTSAGIPYTLLLRTEAVGFPTFGLLPYYETQSNYEVTYLNGLSPPP